MIDAGRHPKITLMAYSELSNVAGYVGNFNVTIRKKARYVDASECTSCAECADICPVVVPDEYQMGLSSRKAIYIPFPQAVPSSYVLNMDDCLGNNPIACGKCYDVCEKKCIDYDMQDQYVNVEVGIIIVATGMDVYDPTELDEYGYTRFENVITSMEFERLICAGGPTEGHFVRPSDQSEVKKIGFIQCVGSRTQEIGGGNGKGNPYCSNICCMNTVKDTLLIVDHYPDTQCYVFYMDIRAFGKGFEDLYMRSKEEGIRYVRGLPGSVIENPDTKNLSVLVENTLAGDLEEYDLDMLVLSVGVLPRQDQAPIKKMLTLSNTSDGFFMESHPKLKPVDAPTRGVYFAGCSEAPKDVKDSVTQAGAAAARGSILLNSGRIKVEAITSRIDEALCKGCGICAKACPYNAVIVDTKAKTPARVIEAACAGCGTCGAECPVEGAVHMRHFTDDQIIAQVDAILEHDNMDKVVVFACNWCSYAGGDMAGISRLQFPASNRLIRVMCSGRTDSKFVMHAFKKGAPIVCVSGCHYADCHYINANRWTEKRVEKLWNKLERKKIRPERLQLEWISAAEGQKFKVVMEALEEMRKKVTREEVAHTMEVL